MPPQPGAWLVAAIAFTGVCWPDCACAVWASTIEPEITARLLQAGYRIHETPVAYRPRTVAAGKKLAWVDGLDAIYTLCRCRFVR
jgi:hypothetical protein